MTAFDILRLIGASVAMILGAIVFLVIFFRGMAWMDAWIKRRSQTDLRRPSQGRGTKKRGVAESNRVEKKRRPVPRPIAALKNAAPKNIEETVVTSDSSASIDRVEEPSDHVSVERRGTVYLLSGEIIPKVVVLSKEQSEKAMTELGLEASMTVGAILFTDEEKRLYLVRGQNIKMVAWNNEPA